ncbi:MAG: methyltransferase domain-containing protein [Verrucomicrobia bacterium]|nr:methyltransferase domain-containing protein [Verrucomicrobiota bacterium]
MFFRERSTQAESFDSPGRSFEEVAKNYRELARVNRLFFFSHPFVLTIPRLLGSDQCRSLNILDIGAGDGSLGVRLSRWAARRGWLWDVTNLDANPRALQLNPGGRNVTGSALALPFPDAHFDVVIASQMTHHLTDADLPTHFREAWRVARRAVVFSDLHRNAFLYALVWLGTRAMGVSQALRADAVISVRRGFHLCEWRRHAEAAWIPDARVWLYAGTRIMLAARKTA